MQASFFPATGAADLREACSLSDSAGVSRSTPLLPDVGAVPHDPLAAQIELDDTIRDLKTLAALAEDSGQIETAKDYIRRCLAASRSRTPEHKDRLAREHLAAVEASLDAGVDYFAHQGRLAAAHSSKDRT